MAYESMKIPAEVGGHSLIGVRGSPPFKHGNYFYLAPTQLRVVNFWAENLEAAKKLFLKDGLVQVRMYRWNADNGISCAICIIDDDRIPKNWYANRLCFTGSYRPPIEIIKEIYDYIGDPDNYIEEYVDPELYYARQGGIVNETSVTFHYGSGNKEYAAKLVADLLEKRSNNQGVK